MSKVKVNNYLGKLRFPTNLITKSESVQRHVVVKENSGNNDRGKPDQENTHDSNVLLSFVNVRIDFLVGIAFRLTPIKPEHHAIYCCELIAGKIAKPTNV